MTKIVNSTITIKDSLLYIIFKFSLYELLDMGTKAFIVDSVNVYQSFLHGFLHQFFHLITLKEKWTLNPSDKKPIKR